MSQIPLIGSKSSGQITLLIKNNSYTLLDSDSRFTRVFDALRKYKDDSNLEEILYDILTSSSIEKIVEKLNGKLELKGNAIYYEGEQVHNLVVDRIIECNQDGLDINPLMKFLDSLMKNPSKHVIDNLYGYLENGGLAVMPDGKFVAYKRVNSDYSSWHKNKDGSSLYNYPGTIVKCKRREVDDNHSKDCSYGLHVGNPNFVRQNNFGPVVLLCAVSAESVVTVPDYNVNKLRTCEYTVIKKVDNPDDFAHVLYTDNGDGIVGNKVVWVDENWDDLADEFGDDYDDYDDYEDYDYEDDDYEDEPCNKSCECDNPGCVNVSWTVNTNPHCGNDNWKTQQRDKYGRWSKK